MARTGRPPTRRSEMPSAWTPYTPEQFKQWRLYLQLSQSEAAYQLGTTNVAISEWENGRRGISVVVTLACWFLLSEFEKSTAGGEETADNTSSPTSLTDGDEVVVSIDT